MKRGLLLLLFATVTHAQSPNVVFCHGDDQAALQNAINAQAAAITRSGGGGPVFVAASSVPCQFATLTLPSMSNGSLVLLLDNPMIGGTIEAGTNTALKCNTGTSFLGLSGAFLYGPTCSIQQTRGLSQPLLDIVGASQFYVEGINLETNSTAPEVVHIHDKNGVGSVYLHFRRCVFGTYPPGLSIVADSSVTNVPAGFGLKIEDSSMQTPLALSNYGFISIDHSFLPRITLTNSGVPSCCDLEINDVLSEGLKSASFLTINQTGGQVTDITLRRVKMADTTGKSYLVRENDTSVGFRTAVLVEQIPLGNIGSGMIDPASTAHRLELNCIGSGCPAGASGLAPVWKTLYTYTGLSGGLTVFGSQYVSSPLQICGPPPKGGSTPVCAAASISRGTQPK